MSLVIGNRKGGLRSAVELAIVGALVAAVLSSSDIKRYLHIRSM